LRHVAPYCTTPRHTATHGSTRQYTATHIEDLKQHEQEVELAKRVGKVSVRSENTHGEKLEEHFGHEDCEKG